MSDAAIFVLVMGGLFVLRALAATVIFFWILPRGDRCPNCDAVTLRVQGRGLLPYMRWFRKSWCYHCGWEGLLRSGEPSPRLATPSSPLGDPRKRKGNVTRNTNP
jgi:hypothetical protein